MGFYFVFYFLEWLQAWLYIQSSKNIYRTYQNNSNIHFKTEKVKTWTWNWIRFWKWVKLYETMVFRGQSFTSLMEYYRQDINRLWWVKTEEKICNCYYLLFSFGKSIGSIKAPAKCRNSVDIIWWKSAFDEVNDLSRDHKKFLITISHKSSPFSCIKWYGRRCTYTYINVGHLIFTKDIFSIISRIFIIKEELSLGSWCPSSFLFLFF